MKENGAYRFISHKGFKALVEWLFKGHAVYGPVSKDGFPAYGAIADFSDLHLYTSPTHLSAKEFFFPQKETLLRFDMENNTHETVPGARPQAVIGLHPCDIHGLNLMDAVFAAGTPDANYLARREQTIVIGTDCFPDERCFCKSVGTMTVYEGYDLYLHLVKKGFVVRVGSNEGRRLLKHTDARAAKSSEIKEVRAAEELKSASFVTTLEAPPEDLPNVYAKSSEHPVWDEIGARCYGCGSCNNVCPTCYCFDVRDEVRADLTGGERVRVWDACTLADFALVAGGHNFRSKRSERLKHRFNRKFRYLTDKYKTLFCVGCGRCIRTCLVGINIAEVTNELIRSYKK